MVEGSFRDIRNWADFPSVRGHVISPEKKDNKGYKINVRRTPFHTHKMRKYW